MQVGHRSRPRRNPARSRAPLSPPRRRPGAATSRPAPPAPRAPRAHSAPPIAAPPASTDAAQATLGPAPSDPSTPDELTIAPKAEAFVVGEANWDDALTTIRDAQKKVKAALDAAGVKIS